ncbi:MAG: sulfite dehydrogenase (cytochrome) subunit [Methylobacteriaceae bacterium]|jgi:mono/diheme cytochrome c family protein|nr:sulfite dehydrogenase (cytochrome) subunit [Methylobacteriaceae bacterium]
MFTRPERATLMKTVSTAVIFGAALVSFVQAEPVTYDLPEEVAALKPGPGIEAAQSNCVACHSADYIAMQPPKKGKAFWEAEVTKMIKTYGAPINEADAKVIADYLAQTY